MHSRQNEVRNGRACLALGLVLLGPFALEIGSGIDVGQGVNAVVVMAALAGAFVLLLSFSFLARFSAPVTVRNAKDKQHRIRSSKLVP